MARITGTLLRLTAIAGVAAIGGCSTAPSYPHVPGIKEIAEHVLTPTEQQEAVTALKAERGHDDKARVEIGAQ